MADVKAASQPVKIITPSEWEQLKSKLQWLIWRYSMTEVTAALNDLKRVRNAEPEARNV